MRSFLEGKILFLFLIVSLYSYQTSDSRIEDVLTGKYNTGDISNFQIIPQIYSLKRALYINKDAFEAFKKMAQAAKKEGFNIFILSAVRNYNSQKAIWEGKFNGVRFVEGVNLKKTIPDEKIRALKILEYSSMPGTSRHHWGTDIDIGFNIKNAGKMLTNQIYTYGEGKRFYDWMSKNALKYGFCQPYKGNPDQRENNIKRGYQEENWHWSYKPLARQYLEMYLEHSHEFKPSGFAGSSVSGDLYLDYVRNIHPDCY